MQNDGDCTNAFLAASDAEAKKVRCRTQRELIWRGRTPHLSFQGTQPPSWAERLDPISALGAQGLIYLFKVSSKEAGVFFGCLARPILSIKHVYFTAGLFGSVHF